MKKFIIVAIVCVFVLGLAATGFTTGGGKTIMYGGAGQGKVIFDGRTHAAAGLVCNDCHSSLFETRKLALIDMNDHTSDKKCFACHNGKKAFSACDQCHRKF